MNPAKTPAARVKLKEYEIACPCGHVTKRGAWSIARQHLHQFFACPGCGKRVDVPAMEPEG